MDIKFHLPDFVRHFRLNLTLAEYMSRFPDAFVDGVKIGSVYGCFPNMTWNGGRFIQGNMDPRIIREILSQFNKRGIPCRFTLTNPEIKMEHLSDPLCNAILKAADNGMNEAIVFSPMLEDYIRDKFPDMPITSSTCKQIEDFDELSAEMEKDYSLVVLDYNFNNNFDVLEKLPHKEKAELLINPCCTPACKRRGDHYKFLGEQQIKRSSINAFGNIGGINMLNVQTEENFRCEAISRNFLETIEFSTHITPETLFEKYVPMGFRHFKIEGRTLHPLNVIESYVYYMTKPEYKDLVRLKLGLDTFRAR